jgi:uncharacterized membrane protein YagU involved in acid resistance
MRKCTRQVVLLRLARVVGPIPDCYHRLRDSDDTASGRLGGEHTLPPRQRITTMIALLKLFIDICLFQAKPQDLPAARTLVWVTGATAILSNLRSAENLSASLLVAAAQVLIISLLVYSALRSRRLINRWDQTISALYGATTLVNLVSMPVVGWMIRVKDTPEQATWPALLGLAITVWFIAIMAHVLRHALDLRTGASIILSIGLFAIMSISSLALLSLLVTA